MLGEALAYPFVLALRRPVTVAAALLAGVVIAVLIDMAWLRLATLTPAEMRTTDNPAAVFNLRIAAMQCGYYFAASIAQAFPAALIFAGALVDLGLREKGRAIRVMDGVRVAVLTALYALVFIAPLQILQSYVAAETLRHATAVPLYLPALGAFFIQAAALAAFYLSWPHTIAVEKARIFPTWTLRRRVALGAMGALLLVLLAATVFGYAGLWLNWSVLNASHLDAEANTRVAAILREWPRFLGVYMIDAASALIYARVMPQRPERVAAHF